MNYYLSQLKEDTGKLSMTTQEFNPVTYTIETRSKWDRI